MIKNKSVSAIAGPEFINLESLDINPLMSKCDIKVLYLGQNRNGSYIDKNTATNMAKTLRGTPIVAAWSAKDSDYGDHYGSIDISADGSVVQYRRTMPLGFVAPDSEVWFQNFTDIDEFNNQVEHTYMMTQGYLWTTQFQEELEKLVADGGQPQSMELDEETLNGHWAFDNNLGMEFFIIDDAVFSKLCILGDNVEPCFEGANVSTFSSQEVKESEEFTLKNTPLSKTLFTMMNELKETLLTEGGSNMPDNIKEVVEAEETELDATVEETVVEEEVEAAEDEIKDEANETSESSEEITPEQPETLEGENEEELVEDKDETDEPAEEENLEDAPVDVEETPVEEVEDTPELEATEFAAMKEELSTLRAELDALREYRANIENSRKDALINSYYMLSDEDKQGIVDRKEELTFDQVKAELAMLYVEKNVDFSQHLNSEELENESEINLAFSLETEKNEGVVSPICEALRRTKKN